MIFFRIIIILCIIFSFISFYDIQTKEDDFSQIRNSYAKKDWIASERLLLKFLRNELDLEKTWQAWLLLLSVSEKSNANTELILSYLDDMFSIYLNDNHKKKYILAKITEFTDKKNNVKESIEAWENYISLTSLTSDETFKAFKKLIQLHFKEGNFDIVEGILRECTTLSISDSDKAYCFYNLADLRAGKEQWVSASELIQLVLVMNISDYEKAQASFLYGDILENQRKFKEALTFFEIALKNYGNAESVQLRINNLKKILKIK